MKYYSGQFPSQRISFEDDTVITYCSFYNLNSGCIKISGNYNFELICCVFIDNSKNGYCGCLETEDLKSCLLSKCHAKSCIAYGDGTSFSKGSFGLCYLNAQSENRNDIRDCTFTSCLPFEEPNIDNCRDVLECRSIKCLITKSNFSHNHLYMVSLNVYCYKSTNNDCQVNYVTFAKNTVNRHLAQVEYSKHIFTKVQFLDNRVTNTVNPSLFYAQSESDVCFSECVFSNVKGLKLTTNSDTKIIISKSWFSDKMQHGPNVIIQNDAPNTQPTPLKLLNLGELMKEIRGMSQNRCVSKGVRIISFYLLCLKDFLEFYLFLSLRFF